MKENAIAKRRLKSMRNECRSHKENMSPKAVEIPVRPTVVYTINRITLAAWRFGIDFIVFKLKNTKINVIIYVFTFL